MSILSIDVGIKNLAICLIDGNNHIQEWKVIDLVEIDKCFICKLSNAVKQFNKIKKTKICNNQECLNKLKMKHRYLGKSAIYRPDTSIKAMSASIIKNLQKYSPVMVLIENQPSLRNPIMKTIQILLFGFFRFSRKVEDIIFRNPINKYDIFNIEIPEKLTKKKKAIFVCKELLKKKNIKNGSLRLKIV